MPAIVRGQQKELVVAGYGGLYEEASKAAFYDPFTKATGIRIRQVSPGYQMYAQLGLQVQNNNPEVDVCNLGSELMLRAGKEGLLAPIDLKVVNTQKLFPKAVNEFGVAMDMYGIGLAYNTDSYPKGKQPRSYAEYWDIAKFPRQADGARISRP